VLVACGGETIAPPELTRIELRHPTRTVSVLDQIRIEAVAYNQGFATIAPPVLTWSSDDPTIATVDGDGRVTGQGIGDVTIRASAGAVRGVIRIAVKAALVYVKTYVGSPDLMIGQNVILKAEVRAATGKLLDSHPALTWATADDAIVGLNAVSELGPSYIQVTGRATGLASITVGFQGTETMFIVGVLPEPVPLDAPVRVNGFYFFWYWDDVTGVVPTMQVTVASGRSVTMTRMEVAVPAMVAKLLPPLCSNGRLSAGEHALLGGTSYPIEAFYPFAFVRLADTDGAALLTYRTDEGREIQMIVRGSLDYWGYGSGYETGFPWKVCP
jgi:hypothetical protein